MGAPGRFAAPVASPSSPQSTATGVTDDDSTHQSDVLPLALVGIVRAMMRQEEDVYAYHRYRPDGCQTTAIREKWRQDICHWVSSVKELLACQSFGTSWTKNLTTVTFSMQLIGTSLYYRPSASWITLIYHAKPWPYRYLSLIGTAQP